MKALTLWQPWAQLLVCGVKHFETRSWVAALRPGETIAIHASSVLSVPREVLGMAARDSTIAHALADCGYRLPRVPHFVAVDPELSVAPFAAVVGVATFQGAYRAETARERLRPGSLELALGDWTDGRYVWEFIAPVCLDEPVPCKGRQLIWTLPDDVEEAVMCAVGEKTREAVLRG